MKKFLIPAIIFAFSLFMAITFPITANATEADDASSLLGKSMAVVSSCAAYTTMYGDGELADRMLAYGEELIPGFISIIEIQVEEMDNDMTRQDITEWLASEWKRNFHESILTWESLDEETQERAYEACVSIDKNVRNTRADEE